MRQSLMDLFLQSLEASGDSVRTLDTYKQRLGCFFRFVRCEPGEVAVEMVEAWIVSMRRRGLSDVTIRGRLTAVKTFYAWGVGRGHLDTSPAAAIRFGKGRRGSTLRAARQEDVKRMVAAARERARSGQARDLAMLLFTVDTGCRAGEVASLTVEALNLVKCEARVDGKTGPRMVDFTQETAKALNNWLQQHPAPNSEFVFVGLRTPNNGNGISQGTIYQVFRRLAREAGVSGRFNPHSIRHLVGQTWADHVNLELVRQKLGHKDISTTAIYANQDRERVKRATQEISILGQQDTDTTGDFT